MATNNSVNTSLSGQTGTGNFVGSTSSTLVTPILGAATATSLAFIPSTGGIIGTATNDNAASGDVGQFISSVISSGSPVSYSTATPKDLTFISLPAGDWDVWGNIFFNVGGVMTASNGWISSTSATLPDTSLIVGINISGLGSSGFFVPQLRFSLPATTPIYISAQFSFSTSTVTAVGGIYARRVR
jgi:hypothetical protein